MRVPVCVVGGAGYVGSQTVWELHDRGWDVVVYDNLSTGHRRLVPEAVPLIEGDIRDGKQFAHALRTHNVQAIVHCAALSLVPESVQHPGLYWAVNLGGGGTMVEAAMREGVKAFIFSSSASVYGEPMTLPIDESHPLQPINPYGKTKAAFETLLHDAHSAGGPAWLAFRYFNAAGADPQGRCGEDHTPETHLIPNILRMAHAVSRGESPERTLTLFGDDYPTRDGTCVRDYVHTRDLAEAHIAGIEYLLQGKESMAVNLGSGDGISLLEMVQAASEITGVSIPYSVGPRRDGDPARLIASNARAHELLGWTPKHSTLDTILRSAWAWTKTLLDT